MLGMAESDELLSYRFRSLPSRIGTFLQRSFADREAKTRLFGTLDYTFCSQHLTLQEIELLGLIPHEKLKTSMKISVCRNPWDRAVSTYCNFCKPRGVKPTKSDFKQFWIDWVPDSDDGHAVRAHKRSQMEFLRDTSGNIAVDFLLRFESLEEDVSELRDAGLELHPLPKLGVSRPHNRDFRDYYDGESKRLIGERFEIDIEYLGYRFD